MQPEGGDPGLLNPDFRIEPINEKHDRTAFCCGVEALDRYLQRFAGQDSRKNVARVYVATTDGRRVLGFYTLSAFLIELKDLPATVAKHLPRYDEVPATLLGRLAVSEEWSGKGIGRTLLIHALHTAWGASQVIGSAGVLVDAKDEAARRFYQHFNFLPLDGAPNSLFLPMKTIGGLIRLE